MICLWVACARCFIRDPYGEPAGFPTPMWPPPPLTVTAARMSQRVVAACCEVRVEQGSVMGVSFRDPILELHVVRVARDSSPVLGTCCARADRRSGARHGTPAAAVAPHMLRHSLPASVVSYLPCQTLLRSSSFGCGRHTAWWLSRDHPRISSFSLAAAHRRGTSWHPECPIARARSTCSVRVPQSNPAPLPGTCSMHVSTP